MCGRKTIDFPKSIRLTKPFYDPSSFDNFFIFFQVAP